MYSVSIKTTGTCLVQGSGPIRLTEIDLTFNIPSPTIEADRLEIVALLREFKPKPLDPRGQSVLYEIIDEWESFTANYAARRNIPIDYTSEHFRIVIRDLTACTDTN